MRLRTGRLVIALIAARAGQAAAQTPSYEQLQTLSYLLSEVRLNYVHPVSTEQLVHAAIDGMLRSLDPHSRFVPRSENDRWLAWEAGRLAGTGILLEDEDGTATVAAVLAGSQAERTGVAPGDRVVAVNDTVASGLAARELELRLVGERGTRVRLKLERGPRAMPDTVTVSVRNELIPPRSVSDSRLLAPGVAYVRLERFEGEAARDVREAIDRLLPGRQARSVVLDLRSNPGGEIQAAVDVASLFLLPGARICRTEGRRQEVDREYFARSDGPFTDARLVVLIDRYSASAAEILAGALQDHDRAVLLGRRSFGKALVQRLYPVPPNGDAVWLTVGYVHTPSGRLIQRSWAGLSREQYYALAGSGGAKPDTATTFRTDSGRTVRGGGGIEPDSILPAPVPAPLWWSAAADSSVDHAIADSVAVTLPPDQASRAAWLDEPGRWRARLLEPFLTRVRQRLGVSAALDSAQAATIAQMLAARAAEVRWGEETAREFRRHNDPDIRAALVRLEAGPPASAR